MAELFTVTAKGITVVNAIKIPIHIATGTTISNIVTAIDITFEGTNAIMKPLLVEWVKTTSAPATGGAAYTPLQAPHTIRPAITTARTNDTVDGGSPVIIKSWYVPYTSGVCFQLPLGRESLGQLVSQFHELRITQASGETAVNYAANLEFEE